LSGGRHRFKDNGFCAVVETALGEEEVIGLVDR
jgi:hypothetical protein